MIGVYEIVHLNTGKRYIGQSINTKSRWTDHKRMLRAGAHPNPKLQAYWDKYGPDAFLFRVLEECKKEELDAIEQKYIDLDPWFNVARNAKSPMLGRTMPKEFGQKLSQALRGKTRTPEQRRRMSESRKGIVFTPEHKAALRRANSGTTRPTNRRQVKCTETGEEFQMLKAVVAKYGGRLSHLSSHLSGDKTRRNFRGLHFIYINKPDNWKPRGRRRAK
jgi:group I intron endonuclease